MDDEFRQQLLADPRRAILEAFGVIIPLNIRVRFIEKGEGVDALVVLPDFHREDELADGDLAPRRGGGPGEVVVGRITRA